MTQRRRRKRRVSYPAALAAATLLVAKHELQQRTGMGLWGPLATRLLAQRLGARTATEIVMRAGHWGPVAARALAHRMGYGSPLQMASQLSSQLIRRAQGKLNPPQE